MSFTRRLYYFSGLALILFHTTQLWFYSMQYSFVLIKRNTALVLFHTISLQLRSYITQYAALVFFDTMLINFIQYSFGLITYNTALVLFQIIYNFGLIIFIQYAALILFHTIYNFGLISYAAALGLFYAKQRRS